MAAGVRRGRLDLGPLRRRDFSRARVLLLCVQALGREADRGRLVLLLDHWPGLGPRFVDRTDGRPPDPPPGRMPVDVTATQVRDLVGRLGDTESPPLFYFDAGYDAIALTDTLSDVAADIVVRIRDDRVFYTDATPPAAGTVGRPRRHGDRFRLADPNTWPTPRRRVDHYRPPLRHRQGLSLARSAPQTRPPRTLGRARHPAHRGRHPDPGRGRTPAQTHQRDQEDPVALGRRTRLQPRHLLAGLPAPLRHRTHLLSSSRTPSAGGPPRCAPPNRPTAGPGPASPQPSSTPSASHGNDNANPADPRPRPKSVSTTCPNTGHPSQSTKIPNPRPRTPQRNPPRATNPPSSDQEGRLIKV